MKNNNCFLKNFKQWGLKVSVSSMIFISIMLLGGAIITLALPSSLNDVKSNRANYQLTAENWDYLVDQMNGAVSNLIHLSGKVSTTITNIINLNENLNKLNENFSGLVEYMNTVDVVWIDETYVDNKIDVLDTSLRQWASNSFLTGEFIPKVTYYRGVFDNRETLGDGFSRKCVKSSNMPHAAALSLWKLEGTRTNDVRVDYCGTQELYWNGFFYNSTSNSNNPKGVRWGDAEVKDRYTAIFADTLLANHDMCTLAGIGWRLDGNEEFIELTKRSGGKIALHIEHVGGWGLDFMIVCTDFSEKSSSQTFSVTTSVGGYLMSNCGSTPSCDAEYISVISGETGDGCDFLKKERATVCVKQNATNKSVSSSCISSVTSSGSLTSGNVGFKITKGTVDQYGRCISNGVTASSNWFNARIDDNRGKKQVYTTLSV